MKTASRDQVTYTFSPKQKPILRVRSGEKVLIETEDAFGGQIESAEDSVEKLSWATVDGATGPIYIEDTRPGDTLTVDILNIEIPRKGVIVTVPKQGVLGHRDIKPTTRVVQIRNRHVCFEETKIKTRPMIGTIGVTPEEDVPCGSLGKHGGNMDVKEITVGSKLHLPVLVDGALFAAGDVHAVQADGELCVSAVEVPAEILVKFKIIKNKMPTWPILETESVFSVLACGETLDDAAKAATEAAVEGLMREHDWTFENAYMFGSLIADLEINQVVDPKKGVRATLPKDYIRLESLLAEQTRTPEATRV